MRKYIFILVLLPVIQLNAQVGIGTSDPKATLDVNGNVRIQDVKTVDVKDIEEVMVLNPKTHIIEAVEKGSLTGIEEVKQRIFALISRGSPQFLPIKGTEYPVEFNGEISGINTSNITLSSDKTELKFPPNKIIKIKGNIGILYQSPSKQKGYPAYITSKFVPVGDVQIYYASDGFSESSTETYDDGGVTDPIVLFFTGPNGGGVKLMARYGGTTAGSSGYYLAGKPSSTTVGTYITIEEL